MTLIADKPTESERPVSQAACEGPLTILRVGRPDLDDPTTRTTWSTARTVRAELLVALLTGRTSQGRPLVCGR